MVLSFDLNDPLAESWQSEEIVAIGDLQHEYPAGQNAIGSFGSPIDADSVDDEVILLPSSACFLEARNHARRKPPDTAVINENVETVIGRAGVAVEEPNTVLSLTNLHSRGGIATQSAINDDELNTYEAYFLKVKNAMKSIPELQQEASLLPLPAMAAALTCPICMCMFNEPSSTVCGHVFCRGCIFMAVGKLKKCPTCRRKLNKKNIHRIFLPPL